MCNEDTAVGVQPRVECLWDTSVPQAPIPIRAPAVYVFALPVLQESALKLATYALGEIDGQLQLPQVRPTFVSVATHYVRSRRGGGETQVAIVAALERAVADSSHPMTTMELRAWALDAQERITESMRRSRLPMTALSLNAPALKTPRAITAADTSDYANLAIVHEAFLRLGGRSRP